MSLHVMIILACDLEQCILHFSEYEYKSKFDEIQFLQTNHGRNIKCFILTPEIY